jgi:hypothetical protein
MITITFQFTDVAAAAALLAKVDGAAAVVTAEAAIAPKSAKPAAKPAPAAQTAPSAPTAEAAQPPAPAAPAPSTQPTAAETPTAAPAAASSVAYPDLQKAVLTLHKLDPTAAVPIAKSLGADTFKALRQDQWAEAHRLVTEAITARSAA